MTRQSRHRTANADPKTDKRKTPDIVNRFLTMNGRIQFHYGEVTSRRFTGKNTFVEEGFWYGDIYQKDEEQQSYKIPYRLTAVLGEPINRHRDGALTLTRPGFSKLSIPYVASIKKGYTFGKPRRA